MKKRLLTTALVAALVPALALGTAACSGTEDATAQTVVAQGTTAPSGVTTASSGTAGSTTSTAAAAAATDMPSVSYKSEDTDATWDASSAYTVTLNGDSIDFTGTGATVNGSTMTITQPGVYVIAGTLNDGQIIVESSNGGNVRLVLNGADLTCSTSAPILIKDADKTIVTLAGGTDNTVTDGSANRSEGDQSNEPDAAIYSKDDLSINGSGSLVVRANYKNGIATTNDLRISGGTITVDAVGDAIQGEDSVGVMAGTFTINAGGNGLQAGTTLAVTGGDFTITTGGGSGSGKSVDESAKGLKAAGGVLVSGGTLSIDSADDSIHSDGTVMVTAGTITVKSGDDGIHAETAFQMDDGVINITQSYEGIESMVETIDGGTIHITSSDDAINVAGGADGSAAGNFKGGGGGGNNAGNILTINGGYIVMDSGGDGIDCNGSVYMNGGTAIVNGPTNNGNGAIDYNGEFTVTAGYLVAAGSSGMAEVPGESSSICSIMVNFDLAQQAGTLVHVESADGEEIITMAPSKQFQSIVVTSAAIEQGATYQVYLGGSSTGTVADTIYTGGDYSGGTEYVSLAIVGIVTTSGSTGGFGGPQGGGRQKPGQ